MLQVPDILERNIFFNNQDIVEKSCSFFKIKISPARVDAQFMLISRKTAPTKDRGVRWVKYLLMNSLGRRLEFPKQYKFSIL